MSEMFRVVCPSCGQGFRATAAHVGRTAKCSKCGTAIIVSAPLAAMPPVEEFVDFDFTSSPSAMSTSKPRTRVSQPTERRFPWIVGGVAAIVAVTGLMGWFLWGDSDTNSTGKAVPPAIASSSAAPAAEVSRQTVKPGAIKPLPPRPKVDPEKIGVPRDTLLAESVDNLNDEPSGRWTFSGPAKWVPGAIKLSEGASISKSLDCGPSTEISLYLQFPKPAKGRADEFRLVLSLERGAKAAVEWRQERTDRGPRSRLEAGYLFASEQGEAIKLGNRVEDAAAFASGWWTIRYHHGLFCVQPPEGSAFYGDAEHLANSVASVGLQSAAGTMIVRGIVVTPSARPARTAEQSSDYWAAMEKCFEASRRLGDRSLDLVDRTEAAEIRKQYEEAADVFRRICGPDDPAFLTTSVSAAGMGDRLGDFEAADKLFAQIEPGLERRLGRMHPSTIACLCVHAVCHDRRGDFDLAQSKYEDSLERMTSLGFWQDERYRVLHDIESFFRRLGSRHVALRINRIATEATRMKFGESHERHLKRMVRLAWDVSHINPIEAKSLCERAVELARGNPGDKFQSLVETLGGVATVYIAMDAYERAVWLNEEAIRQAEENDLTESLIYPKLVHRGIAIGAFTGDRSVAPWDKPDVKANISKLEAYLANKTQWDFPEVFFAAQVSLLLAGGTDSGKAKALVRQALEQFRKLRPNGWAPIDASTLNMLGCALSWCGESEYEQANQIMLDAAAIQIEESERQARALSERDLLNSMAVQNIVVRSVFTAKPESSGIDLWLRWKGLASATLRERRMAARSPQGRDAFEKLRRLDRQIAFRMNSMKEEATPSGDVSQQTLHTQRDKLERSLAAAVGGRNPRIPVDQEQIRSRLSKDQAVVDLADYTASTPEGFRDRLIVHIFRSGQPVVRMMLDRKPIDRLKAEWKRLVIGQGDAGPDNTTAKELRKRLWNPIEKHLEGIKVVLLSPAVSIAGIPFCSLPGRETGTFLIHDYAIAILPSPTGIVEIDRENEVSPLAEPSLLAIGDVDFTGHGGWTEVRTEPLAFRPQPRLTRGYDSLAPLPATRTEVDSIATTFQNAFVGKPCTVRTGGNATESLVRGWMADHRFLHFATHGLLELDNPTSQSPSIPSEFQQLATARRDLGLDSGIALSGANGFPDNARDTKRIPDDGILTALEISTMDLSKTELAVLSACDTALGQGVANEGLLGLQRALHVAGVRSSITTLWKVDDNATQALMTEFYRNLWEKKLSKVEALRQAQIAMIERFDAKRGQLRGTVEKVETLPKPEAETSAGGCQPFYWAAFVLSGDWR